MSPLSGNGGNAVLMPMQPRPSADTSRPSPSVRVFISVSCLCSTERFQLQRCGTGRWRDDRRNDRGITAPVLGLVGGVDLIERLAGFDQAHVLIDAAGRNPRLVPGLR